MESDTITYKSNIVVAFVESTGIYFVIGIFNNMSKSNKLNIGLGILSWNDPEKLKRTLASYKYSGLLNMVLEKKIYFQEVDEKDIEIARKYGLEVYGSKENIGIGKGFLELASSFESDHILLLENDWVSLRGEEFIYDHLSKAIGLLNNGIDCVRMRHKNIYGYPHYSVTRYKGNELDYYDDWIKLSHPHLIDVVHWIEDPESRFKGKIEKNEDFFVASSRYANWTNNPCIYKREFYIDVVRDFVGRGIDLEENISYWWARSDFRVAQGDGIFCHLDIKKHGIHDGQTLRCLFKVTINEVLYKLINIVRD